MEFLTPGAGWLALFAIPVIACYLLKVRLKREPVSTMIFWRDVFEERRHRCLWRRLRHFLSLLISLLWVTLAVLALLNPVFSKKDAKPTVILLDCSGSMGAVDPVTGMSRLDEAKSKILSLIPSEETDEETALVEFGATPSVTVGFTRYGRTLRRRIRETKVSHEATGLLAGIEFVRNLTVGRPGARILAVTDGGDRRLSECLAEEGVTWIPIGSPLNNVAVTRFQPRRSLTDPTGYEILVEFENFGVEPVVCRFEIDLDGAPVDVIPLTLEPNRPETRIVRSVSEEGGELRGILNLENAPKEADALADDNIATGNLPAKPLQTILLCGPPSFFLNHVLASAQHVVVREVVAPPETVPDGSVLVIYGPIPNKIPAGNVILIDPLGASDLFQTSDLLTEPIIAEVKTDSPLMRFVPLKNVAVPGAKKIRLASVSADGKSGSDSSDLPEAAVTVTPLDSRADKTPVVPSDGMTPTILAETPEGDPVYLQWEGNGRRVVLLSVDLTQGDLALRTAFPILIANALTWFRGDGGEMTEEASDTLGSEGDLRSAGPEFYDLGRGGLPAEFRSDPPVWIFLAATIFILTILEWFLYQRRWIE